MLFVAEYKQPFGIMIVTEDIMKFFVNDDCIGCGLCSSVCPEVFTMTDEGVAKAKDGDVAGSVAECAEKALEQCPVSAIERCC